jgi:hypothetical protein
MKCHAFTLMTAGIREGDSRLLVTTAADLRCWHKSVFGLVRHFHINAFHSVIWALMVSMTFDRLLGLEYHELCIVTNVLDNGQAAGSTQA